LEPHDTHLPLADLSARRKKHSVPPGHAAKSIANLFHGDFVDAETFDLRNLRDTIYFGIPIETNEQTNAIGIVYEDALVFSSDPSPVFPVDDNARNALPWSYTVCNDPAKKEAFNASTQQTLRYVHKVFVADECDILEASPYVVT
jgi:hypothetical protein